MKSWPSRASADIPAKTELTQADAVPEGYAVLSPVLVGLVALVDAVAAGVDSLSLPVEEPAAEPDAAELVAAVLAGPLESLVQAVVSSRMLPRAQEATSADRTRRWRCRLAIGIRLRLPGRVDRSDQVSNGGAASGGCEPGRTAYWRT